MSKEETRFVAEQMIGIINSFLCFSGQALIQAGVPEERIKKPEYLTMPKNINLKIKETMNMKFYYGTKRLSAMPMNRASYNAYRGWEMPDDENGNDEGYLVEYEGGYESWSPKAEFEKSYQPLDALSFGHAIEAAKSGHKIARAGWNGKNMFVVFMSALSLPPFNTQGTNRKVNDRTAKFIGEDKPLNSQPYFAMYNAQEEWIPGWLASQSDMLANDWRVVDN